MTYQSVDVLQRTLADTVFAYAADRKKAAGRALGTLIEIVAYYTLRAWELRDHIVIERSLSEYANPHITHNVEFSLHPCLVRKTTRLDNVSLPLTVNKLLKAMPELKALRGDRLSRTSQLLTANLLKRNSCVLFDGEFGPVVANVDALVDSSCEVTICVLEGHPFAMFECKRVGVEEGMSKGPQTIEKAKQGAYVARHVSALQKVRLKSGALHGVIERPNGSLYARPYDELLNEVVESDDPELLQRFVLTVGVVSNHGNWFTSDNHNKELKVLAQSYDWLLFLTDEGLSRFIERLLLTPTPELAPAREAFLASYTGKSGGNRFTKISMDVAADEAMRRYFTQHEHEIEGWYNVIAPATGSIGTLRATLDTLRRKNWTRILHP